ncbi:cyclic nucleotide-binding domain-containing protein [Desulfovermiculus halophilus]|jgi:CRP-like cAMP-binding protein|uniref:cyclic nucleotide-binding domain-containing protein n=1 Tax=Desulfovermiculus halophilus TaxID=339722 RepID=UPI000486652D|nr:cyclic nucleotide-binding domain-containing protein [Desulfovermiculus halophilus]
MPEPSFITVSPGDRIFAQNERVEAVYHLLHGEVSLWRNGWSGGRLTAGHILGLDGAYAPDCLHPCTALAENECRLAAFALEHVPEALLDAPQMAERVLFSLARQLHYEWERSSFSGRGNNERAFLGRILNVERGETVIREGERTDQVYRIIATDQGLEVSRQGTVLSILDQPGEFFGEMAAVLGQPRTATVRSLGRSTLEAYPARLLPQIVSDYPELSWRVIQGLSQRLQAANAGLHSR